MLILVVLLMWFSCYILLLLHMELLRTTANTSCAAGYRCLSVAAVAPRLNMTLSCLPRLVWRWLLAVPPVCCLGSFCAELPDGCTRYYMTWYVYVRILSWSCVLRSFAISQVLWFRGFNLFVSNHFLLFRRPRPSRLLRFVPCIFIAIIFLHLLPSSKSSAELCLPAQKYFALAAVDPSFLFLFA